MGSELTAWNDDPDEIHEDIIPPEVVRFWSAVREPFVVMIKRVRGIIKYVPVDLADGDQGL